MTMQGASLHLWLPLCEWPMHPPFQQPRLCQAHVCSLTASNGIVTITNLFLKFRFFWLCPLTLHLLPSSCLRPSPNLKEEKRQVTAGSIHLAPLICTDAHLAHQAFWKTCSIDFKGIARSAEVGRGRPRPASLPQSLRVSPPSRRRAPRTPSTTGFGSEDLIWCAEYVTICRAQESTLTRAQ